MSNLSMRRIRIFRTLFSVLALSLALALTLSCTSGGGTIPTLAIDETPLGDNSSKIIVTSDLSQWSVAAGSMILMCKCADLTVDRGFKYFYMDEKSRGTQSDSQPAFRLTFYHSVPQGMSVSNPLTAVVYEGVWSDGYENGRGTMIWPDGGRYEGEWQDGKRHGKGNMKWSAGAYYQGDWHDGKQHGTGSMSYPNGVSYQGGWTRGSETGHGIFITADADRYEGDFIDGNGTTTKGVYITKTYLGILHWGARSRAAPYQPEKMLQEQEAPDPITSSAIDAQPLIEFCDALQSQNYGQVEKLLLLQQ